MTNTEYLLDCGWLPSPTTASAEGAWEHPAHLLHPKFGRNLYEQAHARVPTTGALWVQYTIEGLLAAGGSL